MAKSKVPDDHIRLYISRNLERDIDQLYRDFTGEDLNKTRRHKIFFICSTIHLCRVRNQLTEFEAVPIYSKFWDDILGRDNDLISKVLPNLPIRNRGRLDISKASIKPCLIQRTPYQPAGTSDTIHQGIPRGYKLAPRYAKDIHVSDLKYKTLARRVRSLKSNYLEKIFKEDPNYKYLYDCQKLVGFDLELKDVLNKLEKENGIRSRNLVEAAVDILREGREEEFDFTLSKRVNRIFYIPNRLKREVRPHILLNGEPTEEIDIPASQPRFLSTLYKTKHSAEKKRYLSVVNSGKFYEKLRDWTPAYMGLTKQEMKPKVFSQIFFSKNKKGMAPLMRTFKNKFPILSQLMWNEKIHDYTRLACKTQRLESDFVIGVVVTRLRKEKIPCLCVHDSVIVPKSKAGEVKSWFFTALEEYLRKWD